MHPLKLVDFLSVKKNARLNKVTKQKPTSGEIIRATSLQTGYISKKLQTLSPEKSILQEIKLVVPEKS